MGDLPVIEIDSYYKVGDKCKLHRLSEYYQKSDPAYFEYEEMNLVSNKSKTPMLDQQFKSNILSFDNRVYTYLTNFYNELEPLLENDIQRILLKNYIGRNLNIIDDIHNDVLLYKQSLSNLRYNSSITSLNRIIRPFLLCNDATLVIVDVKSAQPYILASILNNEFLASKNRGYNIETIYRVGGSILFPRFLKGNEPEIEKFKQLPFENDFYSYVLLEELGRNPTKEERDRLKHKTMQFLFFNNSRARDRVELGYLKRQFPAINSIITQFLNIIGGKKFSYLLQRTESYLILDIVCKEFHIKYPEAPFFTIHDAVLTTADYSNGLKDIMFDQLYSITGVVPGLKMEHPNLDVFPSDYTINRVKDKIIKRSKEIKHINNAVEVLDINIKKTDDFINKMTLQRIVQANLIYNQNPI